MKRKCQLKNFSLSKKLFFHSLIFVVFINPVCRSEVDYMYELNDGGLDGNGFDFGGAFDQLSLKREHNGKNISGILTFDIDVNKRNYNNYQKSATVTANYDDENTGGDNKMEEDIPQGNHGSSKRFFIENKEKLLSKLTRTGDLAFGTILVIIGFLSLLGNTIVLLVFCFRRRHLSPAEIFLVNLGIVDILLTVASYPMSMISSFKHQWEFGEIGCTVYAFVCYFLGLASIFSVTGIALIRYLKTCNPALGNQITCWTSCKMIAVGYFISFIFAAAPFLGFGQYGPEPFGLSCTLDWIARDKANRVYIVLVTVFCVFLPLFIILFSYTQIILLVKQSDALVRSNGVNKRNMKGSDLQLTWISAFVTLGFVIGWGPYTVISLWASYRGELVIPMWATPIPAILAKSSIAYNPFIYFFFTDRYKNEFMSMLLRCVYSNAKDNKQNNNNNVAKRHPSNRNKDATNKDEENGSPRYSGSSSMTTRQFTSTTAMHITNNNVSDIHDDGIPLQHFANEGNQKNPYADQESESELSNCNSEAEHLKNDDPKVSHESGIVIIGEENENMTSHASHPPSQVITMFTGNGVSTMVSSSFSSKAASAVSKVLVASTSLFSLHSGSISGDEAQQV